MDRMMSSKTETDRIIEAIEKLDSRLDNIDKTLIRQEFTLEEHQRRSLANEKSLELLEKKLGPVFTHVQLMNFLVKMGILVITSSFFFDLLHWAAEKYLKN